jgi:hypothetical protein
VSTNQLRANDITTNAILASQLIAGNNITANGILPTGGILGGSLVQTPSSIHDQGSISSLQVSSINGLSYPPSSSFEWAMVNSTSGQNFNTLNTRTPFTGFSVLQSSGGFTLPTASSIRFTNAGTYRVTARITFGNSSTTLATLNLFLTVNGVDVINSLAPFSVPSNTVAARVTTLIDFVITIGANQDLQIIGIPVNGTTAATFAGAPITNPPAPYNAPANCPVTVNILRLA